MLIKVRAKWDGRVLFSIKCESVHDCYEQAVESLADRDDVYLDDIAWLTEQMAALKETAK